MATVRGRLIARMTGTRGRPVAQNDPLQLDDYNPQLLSPFYNGRMPPEIRECIFEFAMTEFVVQQYPTDTYYTRPNHQGRKKVSLNLLLLCKRTYVENHHWVPIKKSHTFWYHVGPQPSVNLVNYFHRFQPTQLALVREVHLYAQQHWLQGGFVQTCKEEVLQGIRKMKITMRRGDWAMNEYNAALVLMPYGTEVDLSHIRVLWQQEEAGSVVPWMEGAWGSAFRHLRSLQELEMEFETYEYKKAELEELVGQAAKWEFPMKDGMMLSSDGKGIKSYQWQGPPCGWTKTCYKCKRILGNYSPCTICEETKALRKDGKGPMLVVRTLGWKLSAA